MGNAVSAKAADEREARRRREQQQKRQRRRQRRLLKNRPKFDESGKPLHYDKHGNQFYYDSKGNPYYVDETGTNFYLDENGAAFYYDEKGDPFYLDENQDKFYLDENREPYYLDTNGEKYFLDTEGKKYYFNENGNPYLADDNSDTNTSNKDNHSAIFKERRMGVISTQSSVRTMSAPFNEQDIQICSPSTTLKNGTSDSNRTLEVIDHRGALSPSDKETQILSSLTAERTESQPSVQIIDHRKGSLSSSNFGEQRVVGSVKTETGCVNTQSLLSSYSSLSFTKSEFEQDIACTPDYIKNETEDSGTLGKAQIEAENRILKKQLENAKLHENLPAPKSFHKVGSFTIKLPEDNKDCSVTGQTFLPNGYLLLADLSNKKIKLFNPELEPCNSYQVDYSPQGLCSGVKDNLVHVTFKTRMFNGINILKVDGQSISSQQTIRIKGIPYGISRSNDGIAVVISDPTGWQIHLMDLKGKLSKAINLENNFLKLANPEYIAITKDLKFFISDRGSNTVYCFDTNGEEMLTYQQLREPKGLCTDNKGSIFITSPGVVHQISTSGDRIKALMRREITGFAPCGVCYDAEDGLLVLTGQANNLVAFELTE